MIVSAPDSHAVPSPSAAYSTDGPISTIPVTIDALRVALAPRVTDTWPMERLLTLCAEWRAGTHATKIGLRMGVTKNAIVGKAHRLIEFHILQYRPNPNAPKPNADAALLRRREAARAYQAGIALEKALPEPVRHTLPPLASQACAPTPLAPTKRLTPVALNRPLATVRPRPTPIVTSQPPPAKYGRVTECSCPIGHPGTRAFHYCDDPSEPGRPYCAKHVGIAYVKVPRTTFIIAAASLRVDPS